MLEEQDQGPAVTKQFCRLCGEVKENSTHIFSDIGKKLLLRNKINSLLKTNVTMSDRLPKHVCQQCVTQLNVCDSMLEFFQQTQNKFILAHKMNLTMEDVEEAEVISEHAPHLFDSNCSYTEPTDNQTDATSPQATMLEGALLPNAQNGIVDGSKSLSDKPCAVDFRNDSEQNGLSSPESHANVETAASDPCDLEGCMYVSMDEKTLFSIHGLTVDLPVGCDFCPETFVNLDLFDEHMMNHKESRFFSCQLCSSTYASWGNLVAHRKACHRGEVLSCDGCGRRKYHPDLGPVNFPIGELPHGCEECGEGFGSLNQLYRHYRINLSHRGPVLEGATSADAADSSTVPQSHRCEENISLENIASGPKFEAVSLSFMCTVCREQFTSSEELATHMSKLADKRNCFACDICPDIFCNQEVLAEHKEWHSNAENKSDGKEISTAQQEVKFEQPFRCHWCPKKFSRKSALDYHKYSHPLQEDYCCYNCSQTFTEFAKLQSHVRETHADSAEKLTCDICGQEFEAGVFLDHYTDCHKLKQEQLSVHRLQTVTCPVCDKVFSQPTALTRHLKLHNPGHKRQHTCEKCGKVTVGHAHILAHARTHYGNNLPGHLRESQQSMEQDGTHRRSFICEYCGREFAKKTNLQLHVRRHTGDRPYRCQLCTKEFYTNQQLTIHLRRHTGECPYRCRVCKKSFSSPTALYIHRREHSLGRPHTCPHCGLVFAWRSAYVAHMQRHTAERPYSCPICNKTFTLRGKLNLHLRKHESEHTIHSCSDCGENFGSEQDFVRHRDEQCCITMVTFVNEKEHQPIFILRTADEDSNSLFTDGSDVVQLIVSEQESTIPK